MKSSKLRPIFSSAKDFSSMVDEFPILFVIAALTPGISVFKGLEDLKNKESDRVNEMKKIIKKLSIPFEYKKGTVKIRGTKKKDYKSKTLKVPNLKDHRICMSASVLALITGVQTNIKNFETVFTSSPSFLKIIKQLGGKFETK